MAKLIKRKQLELTLRAAADGSYGKSLTGDGNIAGIKTGEVMESAFDKILEVLDRMAPAMPPEMDALTLAMTSSQSVAQDAFLASTGADVDSVVKYGAAGTISWTTTGGTIRSGHFMDGDSTTARLRVTHTHNGVTKTALIPVVMNNIAVDGTSTASDAPIAVTVSKADYYAAHADHKDTKSGFYNSIAAAITATLSVSNTADGLQRTIVLEYLEDGTNVSASLTGNYRVESATAPVASANLSSSVTMTGFASGVPTLKAGEIIAANVTAQNAVKFYYPTKIGNTTVLGTNSIDKIINGTVQTPNANFTYVSNHAVNAGQYVESITGGVTVWDIYTNATSTMSALAGKRIDTKSLERADADKAKRLLSPADSDVYGNHTPASFYDVAAHSNSLISGGSYSQALQVLNGIYQYPALVDYTPFGGFNYTGINETFRYADFYLGDVTDASSLMLNFVQANGTTLGGTTGITKAINADLVLLVRVDGTDNENTSGGWLDANAQYGGAGEPGANGSRNAYDFNSASSNNTSRRITFGPTVKSGKVTVRIGIKKGASITFTGIKLN